MNISLAMPDLLYTQRAWFFLRDLWTSGLTLNFLKIPATDLCGLFSLLRQRAFQ